MQKISLLVADDEDTFRKGMVQYIRSHSERFDPVYTAFDGAEAERIIFQDKPELLLLDIMMPEKSGLEVMQAAQEVGILPVTIILSGYDEFKYAQQAVRLGAKDYILKPVMAVEILKKLNQTADKFIGKEWEKEEAQEPADVNQAAGIAKRYMEAHYYESLSLENVAEKVGISPGYLSTLFTRTFGYGFIDCLNQIRVDHARPYLIQTRLKTYEIAYKVGFQDEKYFSRVFRKITGCTPSEYRKKKTKE